jgi:hypothetical protein
LDYLKSKAEILSADAEYSYKDGVIVLVTGILTGKDDTRRKFSQAFFLAPQEKGYFVLNDVFRYVGESESVGAVSVENNHIKESEPKAPLTIDPGKCHVSIRLLCSFLLPSLWLLFCSGRGVLFFNL